jgi:DNA polymerase epsilon subunit 1
LWHELTLSSANSGFDLFDDELINDARPNGNTNASDFIIDIREYDVPYHVRVAIDKGKQPSNYMRNNG